MVRTHQILLALFTLFFVGVVVLADRGAGFWGFLKHVPMGDKLGHIGLLTVFSLLLNLVLRGRRLRPPLGSVMLGSAILAAVMSLEELSQAWIPSRTMDVTDWLANLAGIAIGQWLVARPLARRSQKSGIGPH
ncbi:VanZ family protein [Haloferula helveola]|uniref:VanZ family protein n=1 Tax=Haloferula helveola TaxID=490095 RepID=UPI0030D3FCC9